MLLGWDRFLSRGTIYTLDLFEDVGTVGLQSEQNLPVVSLSGPLTGRLGPDDVSDADVDWLLSREGWNLVIQERLLQHCVKMAAVRAHFPVTVKARQEDSTC